MGESREPTGQSVAAVVAGPQGWMQTRGSCSRSEPPPAGRRGSRCRGSHRPPHAPLRSRVARLNRKPRPFKCPKPSLARSGRRVPVRALLLDLFPSSADRRRGGAAPLAPCRGTGHPPWRRGVGVPCSARGHRDSPSPSAAGAILRQGAPGSFDFPTQQVLGKSTCIRSGTFVIQ